jgi:hypothetical protein
VPLARSPARFRVRVVYPVCLLGPRDPDSRSWGPCVVYVEHDRRNERAGAQTPKIVPKTDELLDVYLTGGPLYTVRASSTAWAIDSRRPTSTASWSAASGSSIARATS